MPTLPVDIELNYKLPLSWQYDKIEFLGLPHLKDNRPLKLGEIFIPLRFKLSPADKTTFFLPKLLKDHKHLVILGDPGCGKSTLVKQVTHSFSTSSPPSWTSHFGKLLPIPIILRDYRVSEWHNYEDMLRSFISKLDPSIRDLVTVEWLTDYLAKGEAIVLLDGIDEIGSAETRWHLRDKVVTPMIEKSPNSYFLLTSRVVGYDEVRFEQSFEKPTFFSFKLAAEGGYKDLDTDIHLCYVAPFNEEDIEQFITRWYAAREGDAELRREGVESLKRALAQNDRVRGLASNPSLLTLIALIHRVTAHLPSGRIKLYDKITEAYLETIQNYRKLEQFPASLEQMKRWLARVGWEMQSRRDDESESDLLVSRNEVQSWLQSAIAEERDNAEAEAIAFLDYIARRSGLLIPRGVDEEGNDLFSFVHLTFQEYFAALHLRGLAWNFDQVVEHCFAHLIHRYWHETILVLFEMLAEMRGSGDRLVKLLAGKASKPAEQRATAEIFSELLLDSESGLSPAAQQQAARFALDAACNDINGKVIKNLKELADSSLNLWIAEPMLRQLRETEPEKWARDFLLAGDELFGGWPQAVRETVINRGKALWPLEQTVLATLISTGISEVIIWASEKLPISIWLAPIDARTIGQDISLAELNLGTIFFNSRKTTNYLFLLAQSGFALSANTSPTLRVSMFARSLNSYPRRLPHHYLDQYLNRYRSFSLSSTLTRHRSTHPIRSQIFHLALALDRFQEPLLDQELAFYLSKLISSSPTANIEGVASEKSLVILSADAEWIAFQPNCEDERLNTIIQLQPFLKAEDDWTRLLAINNLITLSAGTPELVAERNRLCDKAMAMPDEFTFPAELREATRNKEWFNLPEIIAIIFRHEPGDPFLKPEWFDPKSEESKFFLSPPREFFALAAEVLDPEGKTELAKWRNGTLQNKESSTA